jgi:hypothetical protein
MAVFSESVLIPAFVSLATAFVVAIVTNFFTKRREREADWRKLKLEQYREYMLALSGVVTGRVTREAQLRYADAVNSMNLVAPQKVLLALQDFQKEISYLNKRRSDERHDKLLSLLVWEMRKDLYSGSSAVPKDFAFRLLAPPPEHDA